MRQQRTQPDAAEGIALVPEGNTFWTCLSVRLVFAARSNSSAILSAFLLFVSFVP
jgi:hypothetical protein